MSLIVFAAWNVTERVWIALGSDAEVSAMAGYYARVLSLAIPGIVAFRQVSQFFLLSVYWRLRSTALPSA